MTETTLSGLPPPGDERAGGLVLKIVRQHQQQAADAAQLPGVERALAHALDDDLVHQRPELGKRHFADGAQKRRVAAAEADVEHHLHKFRLLALEYVHQRKEAVELFQRPQRGGAQFPRRLRILLLGASGADGLQHGHFRFKVVVEAALGKPHGVQYVLNGGLLVAAAQKTAPRRCRGWPAGADRLSSLVRPPCPVFYYNRTNRSPSTAKAAKSALTFAPRAGIIAAWR